VKKREYRRQDQGKQSRTHGKVKIRRRRKEQFLRVKCIDNNKNIEGK
jgi:hypothetical protein